MFFLLGAHETKDRLSSVVSVRPPCPPKNGSRWRLHWPPVLHRLDHVRLQRLCRFTRPRPRHPELALWLCADADSRHIPLGSAGADRARELRSRPVPEASVGDRTHRRADGRRHAHDARGQLHRQRPRRYAAQPAGAQTRARAHARNPNLPSPRSRPEQRCYSASCPSCRLARGWLFCCRRRCSRASWPPSAGASTSSPSTS